MTRPPHPSSFTMARCVRPPSTQPKLLETPVGMTTNPTMRFVRLRRLCGQPGPPLNVVAARLPEPDKPLVISSVPLRAA